MGPCCSKRRNQIDDAPSDEKKVLPSHQDDAGPRKLEEKVANGSNPHPAVSSTASPNVNGASKEITPLRDSLQLLVEENKKETPTTTSSEEASSVVEQNLDENPKKIGGPDKGVNFSSSTTTNLRNLTDPDLVKGPSGQVVPRRTIAKGFNDLPLKTQELIHVVQDPQRLAKLCETLYNEVTIACRSQSLLEKDLSTFIQKIVDAGYLESEDLEKINVQMIFARFDADSSGKLDMNETSRLTKTILRKICDMKLSNSSAKNGLDIPKMKLEDKYTIKRKLGQGGQGSMFLANDKFGNEMCVKFYDKENTNAPVDDIVAEFDLMKELSSPRIARTFEMFQDACNVYLVNEPYYGRDLTYLIGSAISAKVNVTEKWLSGIVAQILEGLEYLHCHGVVHCDLKEANVMVAGKDDWADPSIVLIDFGLSQCFMSQDDGCSGTPGYIPPESLKTGYWIPKGDIFSTGVIFYQIATGQKVPWKVPDDFDDGGDEDVWWEELEKRTARLDIKWEGCGLSKVLIEKLQQMMAKDYKKRPTAESCRQDQWFVRVPVNTISSSTLNQLAEIHQANIVEAAMQERILASCNLAQMRELNDLFSHLDVNNDGQISYEEAKQGLLSLPQCTSDVIQQVVKQLEKDGAIRYKAFMAQMIHAQSRYDSPHLKDMFDEVDANGDGWITKDEMPRLAELCDFGGSRLHLLQMMDADNDGKISFAEFKSACAGKVVHRQEKRNSVTFGEETSIGKDPEKRKQKRGQGKARTTQGIKSQPVKQGEGSEPQETFTKVATDRGSPREKTGRDKKPARPTSKNEDKQEVFGRKTTDRKTCVQQGTDKKKTRATTVADRDSVVLNMEGQDQMKKIKSNRPSRQGFAPLKSGPQKAGKRRSDDEKGKE